MLWITILLAVLVAACAVGYVAWPLFRPTSTVLIDDSGPLADLILRKDVLLQSIKELEFDYQTGKLSAEDYQRLDNRLRQQAIVLLRRIDETMPATTNLEATLEEAIRRRRSATPTPQSVVAEPILSCPRCNARINKTDKFCRQCGQALAAIEPVGTLGQ